ncbi:hypothetical protein CCACVL1_08753 [Corchorus capsularis]|uniref:Uncharacterized protein n=1 Tax=Corchorus capsularis TaxID=210143 RepID=A0A1R3IZ04_COCAP|nr:hypothetical protein CCACVL1_08753 [Corchorus capsularis]
MSEEDSEEWDDSILDEIIQAEERAVSLSSSNQSNPPSSSCLPPSPPAPPPSHHQLLCFPPASRVDFSPPRELSQRTTDFSGAVATNGIVDKCANPSTPVRRPRDSGSAKELEIERLKKELGSAKKQLADLKHEFSKLKNERDKDNQLKFADSGNEVKAANFHGSSTANIGHGIHVVPHHEGIQENLQTGLHTAKSSCKAIGVQTDLNACSHLSKKLQDIWVLQSNQKFGRDLISKLYAVCSSDISVLFGFISMNLPFKTMESVAVESSANMALQQSTDSFLNTEAAKVFRFYSALTKISSGMLKLEVIFEALFDLCTVENCTLLRENVLVEHLHCGSSVDEIFGHETSGRVSVGMGGTYASRVPTGISPSEAETLCKIGHSNMGLSLVFSFVNWIYLFELMHQIVMKRSEEYIRLEAVSIMNVILTRSDAYTDREKFGLIQVFGSISQLLKKEAGLLVQKEAVRTLYLLLNCPKLVVTFCSGCTIVASAGAEDDEENTASFKGILEGLVDCIACCGNSLQALELRKNAIALLAFIASSGKSGFEILVHFKLSRGVNFLTVILQILVSEMDLEASVYPESVETSRARMLLIREVLILLNRLVSNPVHSATVLRLLTKSRDMVSLTVDVANRLSKNEQKPTQFDPITKQMRESEIVNLGRIFKRRVSTYLGE